MLRRFAPLTGIALRPYWACDGGSGGMKTFRWQLCRPNRKRQRQAKKPLSPVQTMGTTSVHKTFADDTAQKIGVSKRTVEQEIQIARDLTPEAKAAVKTADINPLDPGGEMGQA